VGQALEGLRPVSVGSISAIDGRWAHNRRAVKADGTVGMPGPTWEAPLGPDRKSTRLNSSHANIS